MFSVLAVIMPLVTVTAATSNSNYSELFVLPTTVALNIYAMLSLT